jgi:hypothetical protein
MTGIGERKTAILEADVQAAPESIPTTITSVSELQRLLDITQRKLALCHDLSKHVWLDNGKRNFELLKRIHKYSEMNWTS